MDFFNCSRTFFQLNYTASPWVLRVRLKRIVGDGCLYSLFVTHYSLLGIQTLVGDRQKHWLSSRVLHAACTKTRNAKTKPSKRNGRNHRNETAETNVTTKTTESKEQCMTYTNRSPDVLSLVSVVLLFCFSRFVILLRSFRFDGFVLAFRVLVHTLHATLL